MEFFRQGDGKWQLAYRTEVTPGIGWLGRGESLQALGLASLGTERKSLLVGRAGGSSSWARPEVSSPLGSQEQPEPYLEALLSLSAAFLRWGPQHTHSGEEFPRPWMEGRGPGKRLLACHSSPLSTHTPPLRCAAQTMTVTAHMISLVPSTLPWPNCKQSR